MYVYLHSIHCKFKSKHYVQIDRNNVSNKNRESYGCLWILAHFLRGYI